jgi:hypothetical protein
MNEVVANAVTAHGAGFAITVGLGSSIPGGVCLISSDVVIEHLLF